MAVVICFPSICLHHRHKLSIVYIKVCVKILEAFPLLKMPSLVRLSHRIGKKRRHCETTVRFKKLRCVSFPRFFDSVLETEVSTRQMFSKSRRLRRRRSFEFRFRHFEKSVSETLKRKQLVMFNSALY